MPAESETHRCTLLAWPPDTPQCIYTPEQLEPARAAYAEIVRAIAEFEPVVVVARPDDAASAKEAVGDAADIVPLPIDDAWLRDTGLEAPQFALLMALDKAGAQPQGAIGLRFALDKTTVSRNLRLLEARGWIEAVKGVDRRERRVALTAVGRRRIRTASAAWTRAQADLRSGMTVAEWNQMFRALRKMARVAVDRRSRLSRKALNR